MLMPLMTPGPGASSCVRCELHAWPGQCAGLEMELAEARAAGAEAVAERDALRDSLEEAEACARSLESARSELECGLIPCKMTPTRL